MMDIIKCECGHYKMLDDELCPNCKADYSMGAKYELLEDQETAHIRWKKLGGEEGFNKYMKSIDAPAYMICPKCNFRMLTTETSCPKCGIPVRYTGRTLYEQNLGLTGRLITKTALLLSKFQFWFIIIPVLVVTAFCFIVAVLSIFK